MKEPSYRWCNNRSFKRYKLDYTRSVVKYTFHNSHPPLFAVLYYLLTDGLFTETASYPLRSISWLHLKSFSFLRHLLSYTFPSVTEEIPFVVFRGNARAFKTLYLHLDFYNVHGKRFISPSLPPLRLLSSHERT